MTLARYTIVGAGVSRFAICKYASNTRSIGIILLGFAVLLMALNAICKRVLLLVFKFWNFLYIIVYTR